MIKDVGGFRHEAGAVADGSRDRRLDRFLAELRRRLLRPLREELRGVRLRRRRGGALRYDPLQRVKRESCHHVSLTGRPASDMWRFASPIVCWPK